MNGWRSAVNNPIPGELSGAASEVSDSFGLATQFAAGVGRLQWNLGGDTALRKEQHQGTTQNETVLRRGDGGGSVGECRSDSSSAEPIRASKFHRS
jgi:hypothetical protein